MLTPIGFGSVVAAVTTPMFTNRGSTLVDVQSFCHQLRSLMDRGIASFLVRGTTGDFHYLNRTEGASLFNWTRTFVEMGARYIAHITTPTTEETVALAKTAQREGACAVCAMVPFSPRISAEESVEHFRLLGGKCGLPIYLYAHPVSPINLGLFRKIIAAEPNVVGIKASVSSMEFHLLGAYRKAAAEIRDEFEVMSGNDALLAGALKEGYGVVSGNAAAFPELVCGILASYHIGDIEQADEGMRQLLWLCDAFQGNPAWLLELQRLRGLAVHTDVRRPRLSPDADAVRIIRTELQERGLL